MAFQTVVSTTLYLCLVLWTVVNSSKPFNWDVKKTFVVQCCEQNLNEEEFSAKFKQCFAKKMIAYKDEEKKLRNEVLFQECQGNLKCIADIQQCIKKQQMILHQKLLKKQFRAPKSCSSYSNVLLKMWNKITERKSCEEFYKKSESLRYRSNSTKSFN